MAYDPVRASLILFGGTNHAHSHPGNHELQDTWSFNGTWVRLHPTASPLGRRLAMMTFDPATPAIVLFGGCPAPSCGNGLHDTWELYGGSWHHITTRIGPTARVAGSMTFDPKLGKIVLFGGVNFTRSFNDTWSFGPTGWTLLCHACGPPARYWAAMAYDPRGHELVLTGGLGAPPGGLGAWRGTWVGR